MCFEVAVRTLIQWNIWMYCYSGCATTRLHADLFKIILIVSEEICNIEKFLKLHSTSNSGMVLLHSLKLMNQRRFLPLFCSCSDIKVKGSRVDIFLLRKLMAGRNMKQFYFYSSFYHKNMFCCMISWITRGGLFSLCMGWIYLIHFCAHSP